MREMLLVAVKCGAAEGTTPSVCHHRRRHLLSAGEIPSPGSRPASSSLIRTVANFLADGRTVSGPHAARSIAPPCTSPGLLANNSTNGDQYVGSAYGEAGILGRWKSYATTRHGGNKRLKALLDSDPQRHVAFWFSILRTLPRSLTAKEVITIEEHYKKKLGTRAFGLNEN